MIGIDLDNTAVQAAPAIIKQLDKSLEDITLADGETKGFVIIPDGKGSYLIVKCVFDQEASAHMINKGHDKVDNLIGKIISEIL